MVDDRNTEPVQSTKETRCQINTYFILLPSWMEFDPTFPLYSINFLYLITDRVLLVNLSQLGVINIIVIIIINNKRYQTYQRMGAF